MRQVHVSTRAEWRRWLVEHHDRVADGVWLVFDKRGRGGRLLRYEDAVQEALCFGWIDSIIKGIDHHRYCRKFTPRKDRSRWSAANKHRAEQLVKDGSMTESGLAKIEAAKRSGAWEQDCRPVIPAAAPRDLWEALESKPKAKTFFETLAPTYRRQFIGWITTASKQDTRVRRIAETIMLLSRGKKLGLK